MTPRQGWLWGPFIAVQFLTRIPILFVPDAAYDPPADGRRRALVFFPLVGLLVGGIGAAVWDGAQAVHLPLLAAAVLTVSATALVTGAFHEDGLADTADALGPHSRERSLEVMRDSRIGTFGAVALWSLLTLKAAALMSLPISSFAPTFLASHVLARWSSLPLAFALPNAREGSGLGVGLASQISSRSLVSATVLMALALLLLVGLHRGLLFAVSAMIVMAFTGLFYRRRFGGITGDCLGATNQIVETLLLLIATLPHF